MSAANCYCGLWDTAPETLHAQGVPEGFCGICSTCGAPGHTRAHPHAPTTDAWCDDCYAQLAAARANHWPQWAIGALVLLPLLIVLWRALT